MLVSIPDFTSTYLYILSISLVNRWASGDTWGRLNCGNLDAAPAISGQGFSHPTGVKGSVTEVSTAAVHSYGDPHLPPTLPHPFISYLSIYQPQFYKARYSDSSISSPSPLHGSLSLNCHMLPAVPDYHVLSHPPDNGKEILSMNEVLSSLLKNSGPLVQPEDLAQLLSMSQYQWQNYADHLKGEYAASCFISLPFCLFVCQPMSFFIFTSTCQSIYFCLSINLFYFIVYLCFLST